MYRYKNNQWLDFESPSQRLPSSPEHRSPPCRQPFGRTPARTAALAAGEAGPPQGWTLARSSPHELYPVSLSPRRQHLSHVIKEPLETLCWKTSSVRGREHRGRACSKPSSSSAPVLGRLGGQSWGTGLGHPAGMRGWAVPSIRGFSARHPAPGLATTLRGMLGDVTWVQQPPPGPRAAGHGGKGSVLC